MNTVHEILEKAQTAQTAAELLELAKAENIDMTPEDAEKAFAELHKTGELSDEELDNVSGGGCTKSYKSGDTPKYKVGEYVKYTKIVRWSRGPGKTFIPVCKEETVTVTESWKSGDVFIYKLSDGATETEPRLKKA